MYIEECSKCKKAERSQVLLLTSRRGYLLASVVSLVSFVVVLSYVVTIHYRTTAELFVRYDSKRQNLVTDQVLEELFREALYQNSWSGFGTSGVISLLEQYLHAWRPEDSENWECNMLGASESVESAVFPVATWDQEVRQKMRPLSEQEKKHLNSSLQTWIGNGAVYWDQSYVEIELQDKKKGETRLLKARPLYVPVSNIPYLTYDIGSEGDRRVSVPVVSPEYRLPSAWEKIAGHEWMEPIPYRMRDLLYIRQEVFRRMLDPQWVSEFLKYLQWNAAELHLSLPESRRLFAENPGVETEGDRIVINLGEFSADQMLIVGRGHVRFTGHRQSDIPLVVAAWPDEEGALEVEMTGNPWGYNGLIVFYGIMHGRMEDAGRLRITSQDKTGIQGAVYLWPGAEIETSVVGHISLHATDELGYSEGMLLQVEGGEARQQLIQAEWSPLAILWDAQVK